jgi:putative YphP/YqiW family bacilliredoxin
MNPPDQHLQPLYDPAFVKPLREELVRVGCEELLTVEDVDQVFEAKEGTVLLVVNSICGCAAGSARPGVMLSLQNETIPDRSVTVFAGQDRAATDRARSYITGYTPSSPSIALFKDGGLAGVIERHDIEGRSPLEIADALKRAYNEHCSRKGPSIPAEEFEKIIPNQVCGSSAPPFRGGGFVNPS